MKRILLFFLIGLSIGRMHSQTFNIFYPIDFHSPPYNYLPNAWPCNSFEVTSETDSISYRMFGFGALESMTNTYFPFRAFSLGVDAQGEVTEWKRYDEGEVQNQALFNTFFNNGMIRNHDGVITGVIVVQEELSDMMEINYLHHYLARFDVGGNLLDTVRIHYPDDGYEFRSYVMREDLRDSTYMIIGGFRTQAEMPTTGGLLKGMIAKVDSLGNVLWWNDVPNTSFGEDIVMAPFGQYCASFQHQTEDDCGPNNDLNENSRIVVCTFNATGIEKDRIVIDNYCGNEIAKLATLDENHVVVAGVYNEEVESENPYLWNCYIFSRVIEVDNIGWMYEIGEDNIYYYDPFVGIGDFAKLSCTDGYIFSGNWINSSSNLAEGYLFKFNSDLSIEWQRGYRYFEIDGNNQPVYRIVDVSELSDCGLLVTGRIDNTSASLINNQVTPWLFRTDEYGCLEPGCQLVNAEEQAVGLDGSLQLAPNPTNNFTQITLTLSETIQSQFQNGDFVLHLFSMDGRKVLEQRVASSQIIHGTPYLLDVSALPSGPYLLHLTQNNLWIDSQTVVRE